MSIWEEQTKPTRKRLKTCRGDYSGCRICPWHKQCLKAKFPNVVNITKKDETSTLGKSR